MFVKQTYLQSKAKQIKFQKQIQHPTQDILNQL